MSPGSRKQPELGMMAGWPWRNQENPSWHPGTLQRAPAASLVLVLSPSSAGRSQRGILASSEAAARGNPLAPRQ
ncbi:hypothetical protein CCMA1212_002491 [Trichoderma ghanense]|uniref:Uncharacterized protein n=1 Tax=Trichoderma ghanense TaxID=65468 RepID=A0ABY2H9Q6_9HYPO